MSTHYIPVGLACVVIALILSCDLTAGSRLALSTDRVGDTFVGKEPARVNVSVTVSADTNVARLALTVVDVAAQRTVMEDALTLDPSVTAGTTRRISVPLRGIDAGTYRVTVRAGESEAGLTVARLLGDDPPAPTGRTPFFGFCGHRYAPEHFNLYPRYGGRMKRDVFGWRSTHIAPGLFDWRRADERVDWLEHAGVEPLLLLCYTPPWASRQPDSANPHKASPLDIGHYQNYVRAVAARYAGRIRFFEVWNEANLAFLNGTAEEYADLHKAAFLTLRRHAPDAMVVMGGTSGIDMHYLDRLADNGVFDYSDTVTVHTYTWGAPERLVPRLKALRDWRDRRAPGLAIWSSEWGHKCTAEGGPSPQVQANYVSRQIIIHKAYDLAHSSYYVWLLAPHKIMNGNRAPKPAGVAHRTCAQALTNARVVGTLVENDEGRYAYVFERDGELTVAAWATDADRRATLELPTASKSTRVDIRGRATPLDAGMSTIELDATPVFIAPVGSAVRDQLTPVSRDRRVRPAPMSPYTWLRFAYPRGSTCVPCPRDTGVNLCVTVRHEGDAPAAVRLHTRPVQGLFVEPGSTLITVAPHSQSEVCFRIRAADTLADGPCTVRVDGESDGQGCGSVSASLWVSDRLVKTFTCNQYEERLHRTAGKHTGASVGVVWTHGTDGFIEWTFDLSGFVQADLAMDCGAHLGKSFAVQAAGVGGEWKTLYEGQGQDRERTWDVSGFCGDEMRVRLLDKARQSPSGARVRSFRIRGTPRPPKR